MPFFVTAIFINKRGIMPRVALPEIFTPRLQFRYTVFSTRLPQAAIYARSAQQPSLTNSPVKVDYRSNYYKMKGKTEWNDIKLTCYQFEGVSELEIYRYFNGDHFDISDGIEKSADSYKHILTLSLMSPHGSIPTGMWYLEGAFIADVSWGNMDYGSDDVMECEITVSYDYAEFV